MNPIPIGSQRWRLDQHVALEGLEGRGSMNTRFTAAAVFVLGVGGFLVTDCSGDHSEEEVVTAGGSEAVAPTAYPFDWCLVTGEELSCKDKPVAQVYKGQLLEFCCKQCLKVFKDDP